MIFAGPVHYGRIEQIGCSAWQPLQTYDDLADRDLAGTDPAKGL